MDTPNETNQNLPQPTSQKDGSPSEPKDGSPKKSHKQLWWESMIERHGSEEAVREFMRSNSNKSNRNTPRGFAVLKEKDPERLKEIASEGGKKGMESRWKTTD